MRTGFLITGLVILLLANLVMVYGMYSFEGYSTEGFVNYYLENAGGAKNSYEAIGAFDNIKGVSSNIMVGQIPTCGTGDSTLLLDEDLLNIQEDISTEAESEPDIAKYFKTSEYCNGGEVKFSIADVNVEVGEYDGFMDVSVE